MTAHRWLLFGAGAAAVIAGAALGAAAGWLTVIYADHYRNHLP